MVYPETDACCTPAPTMSSNSTRVSAFILVFLILVSFWWVVGYSFNFSFLRCKGKRTSQVGSDVGSDAESGISDASCNNKGRQADPGRTFVFAIIVSIIILLIIWAFMASRKC